MDDLSPYDEEGVTGHAGHAGFVHLRVHSAYSLSESTLQIAKLAELAAQDRQPALAITDSFNMFGAFEFSEKMQAKGIQPVIGAVVQIADKYGAGEVALLAQNETGYIHLSHLISAALLDSEATATPVITAADLAERAGGLIILSGGLRAGFVGGAAASEQTRLLQNRVDWLQAHFGDRAYIEIQRHGRSSEAEAEALLLAEADRTNMGVVATNDCHFDEQSMYVSQKVLHCIASSERLASMEDSGITPHHFFKTAAQMKKLFADLPEAIENSLVIAQRCSFVVGRRDPILPSTEAEDEAQQLRLLARQGLADRLASLKAMEKPYYEGGADAAKAYEDRLEMELDIIISMGFSGYFLIVSDFIRWSKDNHIAVGPGRGSGAGSVVAWALLITDLDPLRWGLLFERFLNPERVSMPDFDIDFCQERREEVIRYVQNKYGHDKVAQIITFGTLQARAALRDVGRVLDMPYGLVDRVAKMVPSNPAAPVSIGQALKSEDELRRLYDEDEQVAHLITTARKLEGLYRHVSTHAAGLVIADRALPELVPVYRDPRSDMPVTQFNMKSVEQVGLVKFDFLGLKTLTVIEKAVALLKRRDINIDINAIPLDDAKTYEMLSDGDTVGVFQLESSGMRDVLRGLKPDRFEDIIAVVALYRPGPMENIPVYINRKHGREPVSYMHPLLEPILDETYGIMIYQEQVQQAARDLAGYTLGGADLLRRAMGKKIKEEMDEQREIFIKGASENDIDNRLASDIFDQIASFAGYGFNKSHAAAYALVCYQTAWLKANHPVEFLAASMALDAGNTDKLAVFRQDCLYKEISVLPPDLNRSEGSFSVQKDEKGSLGIRYALGAVRNVGADAMEKLVALRDADGVFTSLDDLARRLPREGANKRQLENLVKAGAFDSLHENRRQIFEALDQLLGQSDFYRREAESSQSSLFGADSTDAAPAFRFSEGPDWTQSDRLKLEFEALGLYLSSHPLDSYHAQLDKLKVTPSNQLAQAMRGQMSARVRLAGKISSVQERVSAKGNRFAFVQLTDKAGMFEATFFSEALNAARPFLDSDAPVLLSADAKQENDTIRLLAVGLQSLDEAIAMHHSGLGLKIADASCLVPIKDALREDGGGLAPLKFVVVDGMREIEISLPNRFRLSGALRQKLHTIPGIIQMFEI
ncbi:MAG: DNA polymerase III subunit alpha [Candidatus Puniceispirillaceae bacterium]